MITRLSLRNADPPVVNRSKGRPCHATGSACSVAEVELDAEEFKGPDPQFAMPFIDDKVSPYFQPNDQQPGF